MQIVINIPDKVYEMVMNTGTYGCYRFNSTKAIRDGVSLDKIITEIHATAELHADGDYYLRDEWIDEIFDKYMTERSDE